MKIIRDLNCTGLLADEVGLGKTITAGIVIKECIVRGFVKNVLILVPPSLVDQWVAELKEKFHTKNIKAVLTTLSLLGITTNESVSLLSDFEPAYGRGEVVSGGGVNFHIFLAKNPASLTANLKDFEKRKNSFDAALFILNDNIPDGRDVSWIYDVEPSVIFPACSGKEIYVSGVRGFDMAVRLDYAGVVIPKENVLISVAEIINRIKNKNTIKNVVVFPNYSAMLDFRKMLTGRKIL